jgi:hypothetical protein
MRTHGDPSSKQPVGHWSQPLAPLTFLISVLLSFFKFFIMLLFRYYNLQILIIVAFHNTNPIDWLYAIYKKI